MTSVIYTLKEVNRHRGRESCWIVIDGKVYDVTKYINEHPGGDEEILNEAGTDATKAFYDVSHSSDAKEILGTLQIGDLDADDIAALEAKKKWSCPKPTWPKMMAVPFIAVTIIAVFILFKRK